MVTPDHIQTECPDLEHEATTTRTLSDMSSDFRCSNSLPTDPVVLFELKQNKLYEPWKLGFRIMERGQMTSLLKYGCFEGRTCHAYTC